MVNIGLIIRGDMGGFLYAIAESGFSSNFALMTEGFIVRAGLIKAISYLGKQMTLSWKGLSINC